MIKTNWDEGRAKIRAFLRFAIYLEEHKEYKLLDKMMKILDEERKKVYRKK